MSKRRERGEEFPRLDMTKLFVKVCGITRAQDAELAASLGASAVGLIFWPNSPRYIEPDAAKDIAALMPVSVTKVGVFVDEDVDRVARVVEEVGLDVAQLHGHETAEYCRQLKDRYGAGRRTFKAIGMKANGTIAMTDFDTDVVLLLDAHDAVRRGGTGQVVNWDTAREIAATRPTILAGGLTAANVKLAVRSVRPYGIDVSSGVESAPGIKDPNRLRSFFEALYG